MNENNENKQQSDLKFSDFENSGITFDHSKSNVFEAMGIEEDEQNDLASCMIKAQEGTKTCTNAIENTLKTDAPMKWKICGLVKVGEKMGILKAIAAIREIPEDTPPQLMKLMLVMTLLHGGLPKSLGGKDDE